MCLFKFNLSTQLNFNNSLLPAQLFSTVKTHLKDVNRWSISQFEELINNLGSSHRSSSLFWDPICQSQLLETLIEHQTHFANSWKPIRSEHLEAHLDMLFGDRRRESLNRRGSNLSGFDNQDFQKLIVSWKKSGRNDRTLRLANNDVYRQ